MAQFVGNQNQKGKPGWKTTEFATMVATVLYTGFWSEVSPDIQTMIIGAVTIAYNVLRGVVKHSEAKNS